MLTSLLALPFLYVASAAADSASSIVCVAGQCLEGSSNLTLGVTLSESGSSTILKLLPGEYTTSTSPDLLHEYLTSSSASLSASAGFSVNSTFSLPLTLSLEPGFVTYSGVNYSGDASYVAVPTEVSENSSKSLSAGSLVLSSDVWVALQGSSSSERVILWNSVPDTSQLPTSTLSDSLTLLEVQSSTCSPACSGAGICTSAGTCACQTGFTGSSCESCESGYFGPTCQACPADCAECDDGLQGTGKCLKIDFNDAPSTCDCINGVCGSDGTCTCNAGWTTASNGTKCATCEDGYFLDSSGNCEICSLGCEKCADSTGDCITCSSGFTQSTDDATACDAETRTTSGGTDCPDSSFSNGTSCVKCSTLCETCNGPTSDDCIICASGTYTLNGSCVSTSSEGVCEDSTLIANNNKHECDSCPAKCTACEIPDFTTASTTNEAQCTGCVVGYVLSDGECTETCPSDTFLSPTDNVTCTACDSSCDTCVSESTFCLTCANDELAYNGTCVSSCPSNTYESSGACFTCHPDCATCDGGSFDQCASCNSDLPVLSDGRCLPTCGQSEFFDSTTSSCQSCDSSCASCSGSGSSNCLACSSSSDVLVAGACVSAACSNSSTVISGLGLCLSDLVATTASSGDLTGIDTTTTTHTSLQWWEVLLMAFGCAFIVLVALVLWRRRMRRKRAQETRQFAIARNLNQNRSWRMRFVRFGERLFGHTPRQRWVVPEDVAMDHVKMHDPEAGRYGGFPAEKVGGYGRPESRRQPSPLPSLGSYNEDRWETPRRQPEQRMSATSLSTESLYTQMTGNPQRAPQPRQPVKKNPRDLLPSRFSDTTLGSDEVAERTRVPTPAQEYARTVMQTDTGGSYWMQPTHTGGSNSKNPFLR